MCIHQKQEPLNGGLVSPVLANVYLHYVLDDWFEKIIRPKCNSATLIRYCDDFIVGFASKSDAEWFFTELISRLSQFGLEVENTKTRIFPFGKSCSADSKSNFNFLGFEIFNSAAALGSYKVGYSISHNRTKVKKQEIKSFIKCNRNMSVDYLIDRLNQKLVGLYNYYGIVTNKSAVEDIYEYTIIQLKKWLSRRSQKGKITWDKMNNILEYHPLVKPYFFSL